MDARDAHARFVEQALDRFEAGLVAYATRIVLDAHAARDVVQETFLRLCREDRAQVEGRLAPWLYTVCRRLAIDERRRGRRATPTDGPTMDGRAGEAPAPEAGSAARETTAALLLAVGRLPARQQEAIVLKFRHGLAYREIAEVTGMSVAHVGVAIHEGMTTLRSRFGAEAEGPARAAGAGGAR